MDSLLITICARGGSKGIPGKNIKILNGIPLLHYTLRLALKIQQKYNADIQLSTDSENILRSALELGYSTNYLRPAELASDIAGKIPTIQHALTYAETLNKKQYKYVLDLDVTSPLRTLRDIERAYERISEIKNALNIFSVSQASRNPYFNMVELGDDGFVNLVKYNGDIKSRQQAPPVYDMNASFYIYRRSFFNSGFQVSTTPFSLAFIMSHHCFDLDEPRDFRVMEILIQEGLLEVEL